MAQLEMDLEKILRYMLKRHYTKDEAVEKVADCLIGKNDLAVGFKHNFRFDRDFLRFEQKIKQHVNLLIDFRRTIDGTFEWFFDAAAQLEKDLTGTQKYYKVMEEKVEAEKRIREKQEANRHG